MGRESFDSVEDKEEGKDRTEGHTWDDAMRVMLML